MQKTYSSLFYAFILTLVLLTTGLSAQSFKLNIVVSGDHKGVLKKYAFKTEYKDSLQRLEALNSLINELRSDGYIATSLDSLMYDSLSLHAYLFIGEKYNWVNLRKGNADNLLLEEVGFKEKTFLGKPVRYEDVIALNNKIILFYENNGFPFVSVGLDSLIYTDSTLSASLKVQKNKKIEIDSIIIKGNAKLAKIYLYNYLSIKPGDLYDESKVVLISQKIKEIQFLREVKRASVVFNDTKAQVVLYLDKKKNSQFDGILGVVPNSENNGKLMLTGEANLSLVNSFYRGETMDMSWRKLKPGTQDLKLSLMYPYLFDTPFGVDVKFKLFKNDTLFLTIERSLGIRYFFTGNNYVKAFFENHTSSLLSVDAYKYATVLPDYADVKSNMYGLEYRMRKLDYLLNPRKGIDFMLMGSAGTKNIKKNAALNESLYDHVKLNSTQYKVLGAFSCYLPLASNHVFKLGVDAAVLQNEQMFENELFRIGGLKSLRGFDEESIPASFYSVSTLEYRFIFEQNSYLFAFWNGAYYENRTVNKFIHDTPYGFGAGVSFETKAGVFSLSYALGKQFDNPIYFKSAKVHFGIVNYF